MPATQLQSELEKPWLFQAVGTMSWPVAHARAARLRGDLELCLDVLQ